MTQGPTRRRVAATLTVALAAVAAFAVIGGTGLATGLAKPFKAQYGPGQDQYKVAVCHKSKVTIRVSVRAWPAHEAHGDTLGACTAARVKAAKLKAAKKAKHVKASKVEKQSSKAAKRAARAEKKAAKAADRAARQAAKASEKAAKQATSAVVPETSTKGPPSGHGNGKAKGKNKG